MAASYVVASGDIVVEGGAGITVSGTVCWQQTIFDLGADDFLAQAAFLSMAAPLTVSTGITLGDCVWQYCSATSQWMAAN
jgi:hypothetical protein